MSISSELESLRKIAGERDRYKLERDDLLAALFTSYDSRLHLSAILLGADDSLPKRSPEPTDSRQGE